MALCLSVNLGLAEAECRGIAAKVAVQLARGAATAQPLESRAMFDALDADGSGELDRDESRQLMDQLFPLMSDEDFASAFAQIDADGDGEVSFDEFAAWWTEEIRRVAGAASEPEPEPEAAGLRSTTSGSLATAADWLRATTWARGKEEAQLTEDEFLRFFEGFVQSPHGQQEFFHRTVFAAFDRDGNGVLDAQEVDK